MFLGNACDRSHGDWIDVEEDQHECDNSEQCVLYGDVGMTNSGPPIVHQVGITQWANRKGAIVMLMQWIPWIQRGDIDKHL